MPFEEVSPQAESLLKDIVENQNANGRSNNDYWRTRFDSLSYEEDAAIRSVFKELKEAEMVTASWADDMPYRITILNKGLHYFEEKKKALKTEKKLSHREWKIAIVSAIIGAVIGLIPTIIQLLTGGK